MFDPALTHREAKVDWPMLAALLGLMVAGAAFIFSATTATGSGSNLWLRQVASYAVGLSAAAAVCFVPYPILARWSLVFYWIV